jgi:serine/tyrosine/threonine adenylyltransferase
MAQVKLKPRTVLADLCERSFENSFVSELPADPERVNVPRPVRNACYTRVDPTPVASPRLLGWADAAGEMLGIARPPSPTAPAVEVLAGNRVLPGMQPYAARYGGHQFGHWAGQLGDGRAITLAEVIDPGGLRHDLQLKGAGRTPYSRTADGRAVLRSSVREFLCSEAMHFLGVPTTRALSLVATGEPVVRDMFYDGHPQAEPGAIVCRVSPSFVRFGNFEMHAAHEEPETLKRLADYVMAQHFAAIFPANGAPTPAIYAEWFGEICRRTAVLMAHWMRVGFVHGVMNTDNMAVLGLTIDYGPYGWLEGYDPRWTPNTSDPGRRYCFANQPNIAQWNLVRLASALYPLVGDTAPLEKGIAAYVETFQSAWGRMLRDKLGLASLQDESGKALVRDLFALLQQAETDMTLFFRRLADVEVSENGAADGELAEPLRPAFYADDAFAAVHLERLAGWLRRYAGRVRHEAMAPAARRQQMNGSNPKYVLRNYLARQAIDALEQGDASFMERLMGVLRRPYEDQPEHDVLAARRPEWARHKTGCSALSCSS